MGDPIGNTALCGPKRPVYGRWNALGVRGWKILTILGNFGSGDICELFVKIF